MKKIPSLFARNYETDRLVRDEVVPGSEWVLEGEGVATRKWDGTSCLVRDGKLFRRYDAKKGRTPPDRWEPAEPAPNEHTGHWPGWLPVGDGPEDRWHREALADAVAIYGAPSEIPDGTYELCGPKVQGNPENFDRHVLVPHGLWGIRGDPRTFEDIREFLATHDVEGIVWWHPDGRKVKIKARDFGLKRGERAAEVEDLGAPPLGVER